MLLFAQDGGFGVGLTFAYYLIASVHRIGRTGKLLNSILSQPSAPEILNCCELTRNLLGCAQILVPDCDALASRLPDSHAVLQQTQQLLFHRGTVFLHSYHQVQLLGNFLQVSFEIQQADLFVSIAWQLKTWPAIRYSMWGVAVTFAMAFVVHVLVEKPIDVFLRALQLVSAR